MGLVPDGDHTDGIAGRFYVEAASERPVHCSGELHEAPTGTLAALVEEVVAIEVPAHVDEIIERIRTVACEGSFPALRGVDLVVRDRNFAVSMKLRRADRLLPLKLRLPLLTSYVAISELPATGSFRLSRRLWETR